MAAGGVDLLRRRDARFPRKDFGHRESGFRFSYGGDSGSRQGRDGERRSERVSRADGREATRRHDDEVRVHSEKKRKFSPIVWEEKDVKMSSRKRVAAVTPPLDSGSEVDVPKAEVLNLGKGKASVADELVEAVQEKSSVDASPDSLLLVDRDVDETRDRVEEDGVLFSRTISMSRWASVDVSPQDMSDDECSPHTGRVSSPESGEFQRERSSGSRTRVSGSDDEDPYMGSGSGGKRSDREVSNGYMDSDSEQCEYDGANRVCFDSEGDGVDCQTEEPTVSTRQQVSMFQSCRNVFEYERLGKINEGTYGVVYKARDKKTGEIVALKKVKMDVCRDEGFPLTSLREISILSSFNHPSIVGVKEVAVDDFDGVYMVMEYLEHDMKVLMEKMKQPFGMGDIKWLMLQLLEGVKYLHDYWVLHRDLKTSNLLINKEGRLKICDFGLSRQYGSPLKPYTPVVVTLWYRAPELLMSAKEYTTAIDMWSVGCIMAEFVAKAPLFNGKSEVQQLDKIFSILGTPNETIWPGLSKLPGPKDKKFVMKQYKLNSLRKKFPPTSFTGSPVLSDLGFDLLSRLLTYDPKKRITAEEALNHKWFVEAPLPRTDYKPLIPSKQGQNRYLSSWQ